MKLLHKNSLSGVGQLALTAALTFFSIPVFIRALGDEAYGAFSIVTLAGNLNLLANLGLNTTLLKFLSVQGKSRESDYDIAVTIGLLLGIMVPLSAGAISQRAFILQNLLGLSGALYGQVATLFGCVVLANLVLLIGQTFTTILDAQQRMYLTNFYQLIYSVLYWGGLMVTVSLGYGLSEVGLVILGAAGLWFSLVGVAAWRTWGGLHLRGLRAEIGRIARKQISFGSRVYTAGLLNLLFEPMTKVLVSRLIGVREVGYLEIAYKVRGQLWTLVNKATYPLYPRIAQESDPERLNQMIRSYQTGLLLLMGPFLPFFVAALPDLLRFWLPDVPPAVVVATLCISTTYLVGAFAVPIYYFLMSRHHVGKTVWLQVCNIGVNGVVVLATYQAWGFYGPVLANSLAILSSLGLSMYYQRKYLGAFRPTAGIDRRLCLTVFVIGTLVCIASFLLTEPVLRLLVVGFCGLLAYVPFLRNVRTSFKSWTI